MSPRIGPIRVIRGLIRGNSLRDELSKLASEEINICYELILFYIFLRIQIRS